MLNFTKKGLQVKAMRLSHRGKHGEAIEIYDHLLYHSGAPEVYMYQTAIANEYVKLRKYLEALSYYECAEYGFVICGNFTEAGQVGLKITELTDILTTKERFADLGDWELLD